MPSSSFEFRWGGFELAQFLLENYRWVKERERNGERKGLNLLLEKTFNWM
jgi:hypothetical protein